MIRQVVACHDVVSAAPLLLESDPWDLFVSDPPYSAHVHANATSIGTGGRGARKRDLGFAALTPELRDAIASLACASHGWSIIYSDVESTHVWRDTVTRFGRDAAEYIRTIPWVRWSQAQLSGDRPPTGCEMLSVFWGPAGARKRWNGRGSLTHFDQCCLRGSGKHPTEKPLDQALEIVSAFSSTGQRVLDACAGSGTYGVACALLDRWYYGLEIDPAWVAAAECRLGSVPDALTPRDRERVDRWLNAVHAEADSGPMPTDKAKLRTWERAQRRLADAEMVRRKLGYV